MNAPGANVGDRSGSRRQAGDRDICGPRGRRARADEQEDRQPNIAKDEPQEGSDEGHDEAPHADGCEGQRVHALEYVP